MIKVTKEIQEIIKRLAICENLQDNFKREGKRKLYNIYWGKSCGFNESLKYLGLTADQISYLVQIEKSKGGE